jgi:hypothetical protein
LTPFSLAVLPPTYAVAAIHAAAQLGKSVVAAYTVCIGAAAKKLAASAVPTAPLSASRCIFAIIDYLPS